ncbi:MAG: tyrosine-type recombinase/integrase [Planctomycetaceae bacterium]
MRFGSKVPGYRLHSATGQAVVTVPGGGGRVVYLGRFNSPESRARYAEVVSAWLQGKATPEVVPVVSPGSKSYSIGRLALEFNEHISTYYRDAAGNPTSQVYTERRALTLLVERFESVECDEFGPKRLIEFQSGLAESGISRSTIKSYVASIKRAFRWATERELVPGTIFHSLQAVQNLRPGRSPAKEPKRVRPVPVAVVEQTLPHLSPVLADVVRVQLASGARPGEVLAMRWQEIDQSGPVWIFRPAQHKNTYRGHGRTIALGPRAQQVLEKYRHRPVVEFVFSPVEAMEWHQAQRRAERKTKLYPSHLARNERKRKASPKRAPGEKFETAAFGRAIARACKAAGIPAWHPHQLRHTAATAIRRKFGIEGAQAALGHAALAVTEVYAERDEAAAVRIAQEIG